MSTTRQLPAAGTWTLDPAHTNVGFIARYLMVTKVQGRFTQFTGTVNIGDDPRDAKVDLTIQAASITTEVPDRDTHLRSADFLDVENHPTLTFISTSVEPDSDGWKLTGDLTIRGMTRPVTLDVEFDGLGVDPWGNTKAAFTASGELVREDWGVSWNAALEAGGFLVSNKITLDLEVMLLRQA